MIILWTGIVGAAGLLLGVLAYAGVWRGWAERAGWTNLGFLLFYAGLCGVLLSVGSALAGAGAAAVAAFLLMLGMLSALLTIVSWFWLPSFLLPRWYRMLRAAQH
ncbi:hypothetical protein [Frondihabitans peucedani]|uniref:Uncharacterized protein n=1 Tax=Frondihabitans peucedani TaxID=598626 RepID=A0ABP8E6C6_9MICO